jgi:hypothetical protein
LLGSDGIVIGGWRGDLAQSIRGGPGDYVVDPLDLLVWPKGVLFIAFLGNGAREGSDV